MSRRLQLSPAGSSRYRQWRACPSTQAHEAALVLQVLVAIADGGWPPSVSGSASPVPRWLHFRDPDDPQQWILAPDEDLWVVVHLEDDTFEFVTAIRPDEDDKRLAPWLT